MNSWWDKSSAKEVFYLSTPSAISSPKALSINWILAFFYKADDIMIGKVEVSPKYAYRKWFGNGSGSCLGGSSMGHLREILSDGISKAQNLASYKT